MEKVRKLRTNKKSAREDYSNQKGITLIALVVTIIVLLILAGVTLNALFNENGILTKSRDTGNIMEDAKKSDLNAINDLDKWIDSKTNGTTGEDEDDSGLPSVAGETIPYYPDDTFTKEKGTNLDNGLVIKDAIGNEYVWIEVPKSLYANNSYNTETATADQKPEKSTDYDKIEYCLHKYTDYYRNGTSYKDEYYSNDVTGLTSEKYTGLKQKMLKSVYENGGFWIGRYEAGITKNRTGGEDATAAPLSKQGTVDTPIYPYTYVTCSQAQTLASKLSTGKSYTSSLMFGVQWDLVLKHIEVKEVKKGTTLEAIQSALRSDSKDWGNYCDASFEINRGKYAQYGALSTWYNYNNESGLANCVTYENGKSTKNSVHSESTTILLTTGASDACKKMNIYDIAGNAWEWTLEYSTDTDIPCAARGGNYTYYGGYCPACDRSYGLTSGGDDRIGFRAALYK